MTASRTAAVAPPAPQTVQEIPVEELLASSVNPRKAMDAAQLEELKQSIEAIGVTNPVLVRLAQAETKRGASIYEIVAGHRRVEAAKLAGLKTVPAIVRQLSDADAADVALIDNLQRVDLSPMEEADGYRVLAKSLAWNHDDLDDLAKCAEEIARKAGKTAGYVRSRLKLLSLIQPAQDALREQLISFDCALLITKLTPEDQEKATIRALDYVVEGGRTAQGTLEQVREEVADERAGLAKDPEYCDPEDCYQPLSASVLKAWITQKLLLDLAKAPWPLDSATVVPEAGPCTECPKRSGSDQALFAELTAKQDVCTDAACFNAKKKAFVEITVKKAAESGDVVLKLSTSTSYAPVKEGSTLEKTTFKRGQWVEVEGKKSCPDVHRGLTEEGEFRTVCVNQKCKVHAHTVVKAASGGARVSPAELKLQQEERKKREELIGKTEDAIREKIWWAILAKLDAAKALQLVTAQDENVPSVRKRLLKAFPKMSGLMLEVLTLFWFTFGDDLLSNTYWITAQSNGLQGDRERMWKLAKDAGVDADMIAAKHFHDAGSIAPGCDLLYPKGVPWPKGAKAAAPTKASKVKPKAKPAKKATAKKKAVRR